MVLEEGLDISSLPETLKEDFDQLNRLVGEYRVTSYHMEVFDLEDLSPRKGPPCGFCNYTEKAENVEREFVEQIKARVTLSKVILNNTKES